MKEYVSIVEMCLRWVSEKGEDAFLTICNCSIPSYVILLEHNKLENKLESLPQQEKQAMWEYVHERFPTKTKEERINCCKIIHCIGELFNKK